MRTNDPQLHRLLALSQHLADVRDMETDPIEQARYSDAAAEISRLVNRRAMRAAHEIAAKEIQS